jgi:hypothetical protein
MLGVFIAHFGVGIQGRWRDAATALRSIGMFASPTFVLLSGTVAGYLLSPPARLSPRVKLIDRGLFLLTFGHLLILGAHYPRIQRASDVFGQEYITDTLGLALIVAGISLPRLSPKQRWSLAAGIYSVSWLVGAAWTPRWYASRVVKDMLFGSPDRGEGFQSFSIFPWFSVFLVGSILGERLAGPRSPQRHAKLARRLATLGAVSIAASLALKVAYYVIRPSELASTWTHASEVPTLWFELYSLTSPLNKYPPGPAYLLLYGGLAVELIAGCIAAEQRGKFTAFLVWAGMMGRASLVVFVVQFYIFYLILPALPQTSPWLLPAYAVAAAATLWVLAWAWPRYGGNQLLTVGLKRRLKSISGR